MLKLRRTQLELLRLAAAGYSQREIAERLDIRPSSVQHSYIRLRRRLEARNSIHMVARALALGIIDPAEVLADAKRKGRAAR